MAAIEAITNSGSGLGQTAGKTGACPVIGFDLLFAVSSADAVRGLGPDGPEPVVAEFDLPMGNAADPKSEDFELLLGRQIATITSPEASISGPSGLGSAGVQTAALDSDLTVPMPSAEVLPPLVLAPQTLAALGLKHKATGSIGEQDIALMAETSADDDLELSSDEVVDPDPKQAVAALSAMLTLAPEKDPVDQSLDSSEPAAPLRPTQLVPQNQPLKLKASRAAPLTEQTQDDESAADFPLDPKSPIARLKINIDPAKPALATVAPPSPQDGAAVAQDVKNEPILVQTQKGHLEKEASSPVATDLDSTSAQSAAGKVAQNAQAVQAALDPVQSSPAKPAPAVLSAAPIMAQLRQTLDTRDTAWRERLVDQIVGTSKDRAQSITVMLRPKSLGDMQLQIDIGQSDTAVRIVTETSSAARLMLANEDMLSRLMEQSGVRLASLTAQSVGQNGFMAQSSGQPAAQNSGGQTGRDITGMRKERNRGADAAGAKHEPPLKFGDNSRSSINLMA